jgi:hypothetical protein
MCFGEALADTTHLLSPGDDYAIRETERFAKKRDHRTGHTWYINAGRHSRWRWGSGIFAATAVQICCPKFATRLLEDA